ncbi:gamma-glutamyltransferase family protein [Ornithinimicrobium tianjinense]|uniref:Gamma-glutamyltransferase n=1 Tax=Ornithinimicrobium tianjinense TaxID=1195761 RepID=A0A917BD53_9MICO|nr:gamma-glutamyltransferase [Ornithinimicrobium tianjinense]GGF38297.1 gamma-glutamyltransferase [Ornithinimicrobium tianjinense]
MTFTTRPTLTGTFGMVSSTHWLASQAAMRMLELDGNAADAAVAAGLVLQVVEPHLNGPGGDLPLIVASADDPTPRVLCGQGPAPAGAAPEHFAAVGLDRVPGSGPLATAVPGAFDAWMVLLRDRGTMTAREVAGPALHYARHGHPFLARASATVAAVAELFTQDWTTSADQWLVDGRPPAPGSLVTNTAWADTLDRLLGEEDAASGTREQGIDALRRAWSHGFVAQALEDFQRRDFRHSGGQVLPGVLTAQDLAEFEATWEDAVTLDWRGHTIAKTGPWGQGPALLQVHQTLDVLAPDGPDLDTADGVHTLVETWKLAMADREAWYGDSAEVPLDELLDPGYAAQRASLVGPTASREVRPGAPGGRTPRLAAQALRVHGAADRDATVGEPTVQRDGRTRGDTCHVDVVDRWGMLVSATPSGGWLQSSPFVPEVGFALGSRLQMAWLEQGLPASLVPGRRPRTTLTPTLVLRDGIPVLACGSPGGDQQDQWQSVFLLRHLVGGAGLQEAIDAPSFHTTSFPGSFHPRATEPGVLVAESRLGEEILDSLRERGHEVVVEGPWSLGRLCAVARDPGTGVLSAAANPRGMQGYAVGR